MLFTLFHVYRFFHVRYFAISFSTFRQLTLLIYLRA